MTSAESPFKDILALAAGLLLPLAFSPFDFAFLAPVALALLFYVWAATSPGRAAFRGYLFGLGQFGLGTSWVYVSMHDYGGASELSAGGLTLLLVAFLALFPALVGWLGVRLFPVPGFVRWVVGFPVLWIGVEFLRGDLILGGFPWLQTGYSQIDQPLSGFAPLVGVYGIGWLLAVSSALVLSACLYRGASRWVVVAAAAAIWIAGAGLRGVEWTRPAGNSFRATLIQGNIRQDVKWQARYLQAQLDLYADLSRRHWDSRLVVWPETALPAFYHQIKEAYLDPLAREAQRHGVDLLVGLPVMGESSKEYYNALVRLGDPVGIYRKRHLVPFGEYLPLQPFSGFVLDILEIPLSDFSAGTVDQPLLRAAGHPLVATICYEDAFGRDNLIGAERAAYLVNVSNDGWFGDSIAPRQHLQMARMRTLETRRYMLRATNTGVSAVISPQGEVVAEAPPFTATSVSAEIRPMAGVTPYMALGNSPIILALFGVGAGGWLLTRRGALRRRSGKPGVQHLRSSGRD